MIYPTVYIVVLNWNKYGETRQCLDSLEQATYPNLRIIVVDNGSTNASGRQLQEEFPHLRFVFNDKNLGFARGCNVGIRLALRDEGCSYVLLLNNDTVVTPHFLEKAVTTAEADGRIGVVGAKILFSAESNTIWYAGGHITRGRWRRNAIVRGSWEIDQGKYDKPGEVGFVIGACMLIKREVLEEVGLLPEEYFFGTEEVDYSLQVQQAGYKLYYVPEFLIYHKGDNRYWDYDPKFVYNTYRNKLIFQEKYFPKWLFPLWKLTFVVYARFLSKRTWKRLIKIYGDKSKEVPWDDMKFALQRAIADHGTGRLSEETLIHFDKELKRNRSALKL